MKDAHNLPLALADLVGRGEDKEVIDRLRESEPRIRRAFAELFRGYGLKAEDVLNEVEHVDTYNGTVSVTGIAFFSYCEHHFAPFYGHADITYEPGTIITGIGKLARLVRDVHAARLQLQEFIARDVALDLMRVLKAKGAYVRTTAVHLCMCARGPRAETAETIVEYGAGTLKDLRRP